MIKCPNCGESHYVKHYSTSTALGWIQEYKDDIPVNNNPNVTTTYCTCCTCGHDFFYTEQYGEIQEIVDKGKKPEVPIIEMPIHTGKPITLSTKQLTVKPSTEICTKIATSEDIERIEKRIERLTKMVESLWEWNTHDVFEDI